MKDHQAKTSPSPSRRLVVEPNGKLNNLQRNNAIRQGGVVKAPSSDGLSTPSISSEYYQNVVFGSCSSDDQSDLATKDRHEYSRDQPVKQSTTIGFHTDDSTEVTHPTTRKVTEKRLISSPARDISKIINGEVSIAEELSQDFDTKCDLQDKVGFDEETKQCPVSSDFESSEYSLYGNVSRECPFNSRQKDQATEDVEEE